MNSHAVNALLTETLGYVDGMQADAEVEAGAEVQAILGVEVRMGFSAVQISGATLSIKILSTAFIFVQITWRESALFYLIRLQNGKKKLN